MLHFPINHKLAGFYRVVGVLTAAGLLAWAIADRNIPVGIVAVAAAAAGLIGGNVLHFGGQALAYLLMLAGIVGLLLAGSSMKIMDVSEIVILFVAGALMLTSAMYSRTGTNAEARGMENLRHSSEGRVAEPAKLMSNHGRG